MLLLRLAICLLAAPSISVLNAQDDQSTDLESLIRKLSGLTQEKATDSESLKEQFQNRIELANEILLHPELEENQRAFAELTKLQSFGFLFGIDQRQKKNDADLLQKYQALIEKLVSDTNERISLEAVSANANLTTGLYAKDPNSETTKAAVDALKKLVDIAPKDPIIQTTKRLLLERVWNSDQPKELFQALVESGDVAAKLVLPSFDKDEQAREKAEFKWAKHFSKFNDFVAINRLAAMYEQGKGTRANNTQAARWYEKLARLGDLKAQTKLGDFYLKGKGYSVNAETAVEYYQKAATAGYRIAQFKLGECFREGVGVEASRDDWNKWIKSAAFNASGIDVQELYESVDFKKAPDSFQIFYEILVDQNPDDIYYLNNLAYSLLIGTNKEPKRSLELIDKAIAGAGEDFEGLANFQDTRAHALKHLGKFKEAAAIFESVLEKLDDKKSILEALVECYSEIDETKAEEYRVKLSQLSNK